MNTRSKIFFGKGIYILLLEFFVLLALVMQYYISGNLSVDDGKPLFNSVLMLLTFTGGVIAIQRMQDWGGYSGILGKVMLLYAVGLFSWGVGTIIWGYHYIVLNNAIPYPSSADLVYILINPSFIIAFVLLSHTIALKGLYSLKKESLYFFLVPICMALLTFYFVFIRVQGSGLWDGSILKLLLDFYYSAGDITQMVVLMIVSGTTFNYLGQKLRLPFVLLVASLIISYIADSLYAYGTSVGTYTNGGVTDLLFVLLLFLLSLGIYTLHPRLLDDSYEIK